MTKELILVGAGGHGKACIEIIESTSEFHVKGFIDAIAGGKQQVSGYPILGNDSVIDELAKKENVFFLITVGQIKTATNRIRIYEHIISAGGKLATIISSSAIISKRTSLGPGTIAMHQVLVNADVRIGKNVILNNKSLIEHDCQVGDHVHISTGALVNGGCTIGNRVFIGSGTILRNDVSICDDVVIGAGSFVHESIGVKGIYSGSPAKWIKEIN